ncbi:MAG: cyclodeaminase/cyclohydrolase family protein [Nocardioidaceae bacterium]
MPDRRDTASYGDLPLGEFLERVASREPAPAGGSVAAVAVSLAAGLVAMAARFSAAQLDDDGATAEVADSLRLRALALADADADTYGEVLAAYRLSRDDPARREEEVRRALERASAVQVDVAEAGGEAADLAARLATVGKPDVRGDAAVGLTLAEAAVRSAADLVAINVNEGGCDLDLLDRVGRSLDRTRSTARSADSSD